MTEEGSDHRTIVGHLDYPQLSTRTAYKQRVGAECTCIVFSRAFGLSVREHAAVCACLRVCSTYYAIARCE